MAWTRDSWRAKPQAQALSYPDEAALAAVIRGIERLPPLTTAWEIERLRGLIAEAQEGKRFILQGGDCAESFAECRPEMITNKLKILLQMSLVLIHATKQPVTRIGRFGGQYAKPRSQPQETRGELTLPSYFGDMFNRPDFDADARRPDPSRLLAAYQHSALTLNFVRSLSAGGFADLHHPEYWDLSFFERADVSEALREQYRKTSASISHALSFMAAITQVGIDDLSRVDFYASHEALHLPYETAQTRAQPPYSHTYCLSTHLPWLGERTRALDGAHVEWFSGIRNPIGVKLSQHASADDTLGLLDRLNPQNEPGRMVFITRMGCNNVEKVLPGLLDAVRRNGRHVLWLCDPMHGNTKTAKNGLKTRDFDDILTELERSFAVHRASGARLGGVHFELTGEDVTECTGGGISVDDLDKRYASLCDPRLNYRQALEMAFRIATFAQR